MIIFEGELGYTISISSSVFIFHDFWEVDTEVEGLRGVSKEETKKPEIF
jgi:hypothetical protein